MAKAAEAMKSLIAASSTFQTMVGAASAAAAKASIYLGAYTPAGAIARPFALVSSVSADRFSKTGLSGWVENGSFKILIERDIAAGYQPDDRQNDAELEFRNLIGKLLEEIADLSCQPGYLVLRSIEITDGPYRYESKTGQPEVMGCWMAAEWGLE
jgi:hypothetical protein